MSCSKEIVHDIFPLLRVYKNGRVKRLTGTERVPPSVHPVSGVRSKDVGIIPETGLSARLYLPKSAVTDHKLPLLLYIHGGGFVTESPFSPTYHNHLNFLVAEANVVAISIDYRKAPEHPLPIGYEDSWAVVKWVASNSSESGAEPWLKGYADFGRVFFGGDSAGANIAHNMGIRVGLEGLDGVDLEGLVLVNPFFWGTKPIGGEGVGEGSRSLAEKLWRFANPGTSGTDDPLLNPSLDPRVCRLGCKRVIVFVAEKDGLRDRGWYYKEVLEKSGWAGKVDVLETEGEDHVFHLFKPISKKAVAMVKAMASFINGRNRSIVSMNGLKARM